MRIKLLIGAATVLAATVLPAVVATASAGGSAADPNRATVRATNGPYGEVLKVGGLGAGYVPATTGEPAHYVYPPGSTLYVPTIDPPVRPGQTYTPGCTTTLVSGTSQGTLSCTGGELDRQADWPALTTDKPPLAGRGIDASMLGEVYRADLGTYQVTYNGHPLYLFNPGNSYLGQDFYETDLPLPPWHTAWFLLSGGGLLTAGPATLETEAPQTGTTYSTTELAVEMLPKVVPGGAAVSAYSYSTDSSSASTCLLACARFMIPVYTDGPPVIGSGVNASEVGTIARPDGTEQVTYDGKPLYIFSRERPLASSKGLITTGSAGNGNGATFGTGTFSLVTP